MEDNSIKLHKWLYPVSFLYGIGIRLRNNLFDWRLLRSRSFDIPIISIGNITVGGTGKTPHTEYLIQLLQEVFQVAVLSRGYKRKSKGFQLIQQDTPVEISGDEPFQMKRKFPSIHMAVDADRCHGIDMLMCDDITPGAEVILLDDAFQHRYVQPGINILLIDYNRLICNDALLPVGRLREPESGKHRANIVIVTKCPDDIKPMDYRVLSKQLDLFPYQQLYFSTLRYGNLQPLFVKGEEIRFEQLCKNDSVLLFTAIASPKQIVQELDKYPISIQELTFSDHHFFTRKDIEQLEKSYHSLSGEHKYIVTTEKDATRLLQLPYLSDELKQHLYTLPVHVEFLQNQQETFNQNIIGYVRKNKRNSILSQRKNAHKS